MLGFLRGLICLIGIFNILIGVGFLFLPSKLAEAFFLTPVGTEGLATLRADFPGFFIGAALFALAGAIRNQAAPLLVPLVMLTIALVGRCVSALTDGFVTGSAAPMIVELVMITILFIGYRTFGQANSAR